jgi:hypothetical protein
VRRFRSIGRSVFHRGDGGRHGVAGGRRDLFLGSRGSLKPAGAEGAVPAAASARSLSIAGSGAPPPRPSLVAGAVTSSAAPASSSGAPVASASSRAAASGPPPVIRGMPGMAIQSPSVKNGARGGVPPNRAQTRS